MQKWLIFFDEQCPLCQKAVRLILSVDHKKKFIFAPLRGVTAKRSLQTHDQKRDTLILTQDGKKIWTEGRAVVKILWILGGRYRLLGWLSFFPSALLNTLYRIVARHRFRLFKKRMPLSKEGIEDRFLP